MRSFIFYIILVLFALLAFSTNGAKPFRIKGYAQGTTYSILYYAHDSLVSFSEIENLFEELDSSLSIYKPYSTITNFNESDRGIKIDSHLKKVVQKSIDVYQKTKGIFDITIYPIVKAWGFAEKSTNQMPDSAEIKRLINCVGSDKISLLKDSLIKKEPCVKIDVNGIAQGYTVDYIADYLEKKGIKSYLVEVGGELRVKGKKPDGEYMKVGIESPPDFAYQEAVIDKIVSIERGAITTSGNYRKYIESNGTRVTHLMNPKTGFPIKTNMISVTIIANDAFTADAYDNALMGIKLEEALKFAEQNPDIQAYFIYKDKNGAVKDTLSAGFRKYIK